MCDLDEQLNILCVVGKISRVKNEHCCQKRDAIKPDPVADRLGVSWLRVLVYHCLR